MTSEKLERNMAKTLNILNTLDKSVPVLPEHDEELSLPSATMESDGTTDRETIFDCPLHILPPVLARYIAQVAEVYGVPPDFVLPPVFAAIGTILGVKHSTRFNRFNSSKKTSNLFGLTVAKSGSTKSPPMEHVYTDLSKVVGAIIESLAESSTKAHLEYQEQLELIEDINAEIKKLKLKRSKPGASEEIQRLKQEKAALRFTLVAPPPTLRLTIGDDVSDESFQDVMADHYNGLGMLVDEADTMIDRCLSRDGARFRNLVLSGASGSRALFAPIRLSRKGKAANGLCLSFCGSITENGLLNHINSAHKAKKEDGLFQRFQILVCPDPRVKVNHSFAEDSTIYQDFKDYLWALNMLAAPKSSAYHLSTDAQIACNVWCDRIRLEALKTPIPMYAAHIPKYRGLILTIAQIFHISNELEKQTIQFGLIPQKFDQELKEVIIKGVSATIELPDLKRAIVFIEYLKTHANRIYTAAIFGQQDKLVNSMVLNWIMRKSRTKNKTHFSRREIQANAPRDLRVPGLLDKEIDALVDGGFLARLPKKIFTPTNQALIAFCDPNTVCFKPSINEEKAEAAMAEALKTPRPSFRFRGVVQELYNANGYAEYRLNLGFIQTLAKADTLPETKPSTDVAEYQDEPQLDQDPKQTLISSSAKNADPVILTKAEYCDLRRRVFNIDSAQKTDEETENTEWFLALSPEAQQDLRAERAGLCSIEPGTNPLFLALEPQLQADIRQQYKGVDEYGMCPNGKPFEIEVEQ